MKKAPGKNESPQRNMKGRSVSASASKSAAKKRVGRKSPDVEDMIVIREPMDRPFLRYIPDRATV